jgi:hypothetical protein
MMLHCGRIVNKKYINAMIMTSLDMIETAELSELSADRIEPDWMHIVNRVFNLF